MQPAVRFPENHPARDRQHLRVLHALKPPDGRTRYVDHMTAGAPPEIRTLYFGWRLALTGAYDVLHVHWPEQLLRDTRRWGRIRRGVLLELLLVRLALTRTPVVRTLHNLEPHEGGGRLENWQLARLDRRTSAYILLNSATPKPDGKPSFVIRHGHYKHLLRSAEKTGVEPQRGRLLYFGLIRPYKGVDLLLRAFSSWRTDDVSLRIVGRPSEGMGELVVAAARSDKRVSHLLEFVEDETLVEEVLRAEVVVLPYREMHNSGTALVALSFERPILVPRTDANEALDTEVGPGWVHMFDGELTAEVLEGTLTQARRRPSAPPDLSGRGWSTVGEAHYNVYLNVVRRRSRSRTRGSGASATAPSTTDRLL